MNLGHGREQNLVGQLIRFWPPPDIDVLRPPDLRAHGSGDPQFAAGDETGQPPQRIADLVSFRAWCSGWWLRRVRPTLPVVWAAQTAQPTAPE